MVRIDQHMAEYFLFQTLWVLFKSRFTQPQRRTNGAFETQSILDAWAYLPGSVVRPERTKRQYLSGVLARNEVDRDYAYNRALFKRVAQGWYQFNPQLSVRRGLPSEERWVGAYTALNLPLINEFAWEYEWVNLDDHIASYMALGGLPERSNPVATERRVAQDRENLAAKEATLERLRLQARASRATVRTRHVK